MGGGFLIDFIPDEFAEAGWQPQHRPIRVGGSACGWGRGRGSAGEEQSSDKHCRCRHNSIIINKAMMVVRSHHSQSFMIKNIFVIYFLIGYKGTIKKYDIFVCIDIFFVEKT